MANNSTQKCCNSHGEKVNFEIDKCSFLFPRFMDFVSENETQNRNKQIGKCYNRFVNPDTKKVYCGNFVHFFAFRIYQFNTEIILLFNSNEI